MLHEVVKKLWAEFFALRLWRRSGQPCNNQQSYGQMDVTAGFSRSERSINNLERNSNCSGRMFYGRENLWISNWAWPKTHMAPAFLHISRKLLSVLLAEQHGVYCHSLPGLCVRKCGTEVVVVVQTLCRRFLAAFWCCAASQYLAVSPYCAALLCYTVWCVRTVNTLLQSYSLSVVEPNSIRLTSTYSDSAHLTNST